MLYKGEVQGIYDLWGITQVCGESTDLGLGYNSVANVPLGLIRFYSFWAFEIFGFGHFHSKQADWVFFQIVNTVVKSVLLVNFDSSQVHIQYKIGNMCSISIYFLVLNLATFN